MPAHEPARIDPMPDAMLDLGPPPCARGARYGPRESVALEFLDGLQRLEPRARAAAVLADVCGFGQPEVAVILGTDEEFVDAALERARTLLDARVCSGAPAGSVAERRLLVRFRAAYEAGDAGRLRELLAAGAVLRLRSPPLVCQGRAAVAAFLAASACSPVRLLATRANGQPAFASYARAQAGSAAQLCSLLVLTVGPELIEAVTRFDDPRILRLFAPPAGV